MDDPFVRQWLGRGGIEAGQIGAAHNAMLPTTSIDQTVRHSRCAAPPPLPTEVPVAWESGEGLGRLLHPRCA